MTSLSLTGCRGKQNAEIEITSDFGIFRAVSQPGNFPEARRGKDAPERRQIRLMAFTRRNHVVGYPARKTQPGLLYGLRGQHGVIDAAQLDADDKNDRKLLGLHPVSKRLRV